MLTRDYAGDNAGTLLVPPQSLAEVPVEGSTARDLVAAPEQLDKLYRYLPLGCAIWSLAMSFVILPFTTTGDQLAYRFFYETRSGVDWDSSFAEFGNILGSQEPGYFVLVMLCHSWLDKDILMSVINAIFGYYVGRSLAPHRPHPLILFLLSTNFYLVILFISAERFKVGTLFVLVGAAHTGWRRYLALGAAVLSHVQSVLLVVAHAVGRIATSVSAMLAGRVKRENLWRAVGAIGVGLTLVPVLDHVVAKLDAYAPVVEQESLAGRLGKPAAIALVTLAYAGRRRFEAFATQMPIIIAAYFVGAERLVVFSFMIFLSYALRVRRGLNAGVLMVCLYFAITGVVAVIDTYYHSNPFYWKTSVFQRFL